MSRWDGRDREVAGRGPSAAPNLDAGIGKQTQVDRLTVQRRTRDPGIGPTTQDVQPAQAAPPALGTIQRQAVPPTGSPPPTTAPAAAPTDTTITDTPRVESVEILHAEEIFADVPANTVAKKHAFDRLNKAVRAEHAAEQAVAAAKTPAATAKSTATLAAATTELAAATEAIQSFVVDERVRQDKATKDLKSQLAAANKKTDKDPKAIAELEAAIAARKTEIRAEVAGMKHTDVGHTGDSAFAPVATDVTHHDFAFADDEHVKLRDHVVAYATTVPFGVDSEGAIDHAQVTSVMATAGLSGSRRKILQAISGFEGGFDSVNTYDRAKVTWGFVQWAGGSHSDLTQTLTIIKQQHAAAFAANFTAYGIDVVSNQLVITPPDGSPALKGDAAADAIMRNPRLAAVMAHAGRNTEIQKGEVQAASQLEIDKARSQSVSFVAGAQTVITTAGALITSEYGVGLLANTFVHSGSGAAQTTVHAAVVDYVAKHPYVAGDEAWRAGAEAAIISALAAKDSDRAAALNGQLSADPGSFQ
jgi:hypothetical protein